MEDLIERRNIQNGLAGRRKLGDRRLAQCNSYGGPERRSGMERRVVIDRRPTVW